MPHDEIARAQTARVLLEATDLPIPDIAFAAGFATVRPCDEALRATFAASATRLRAARRAPTLAGAETVTLRLAYRAPMDLDATLTFLSRRAIPHVEACEAGRYMRTVRAPGGPARISLSDAETAVACRVELTDRRDLGLAISRARRMLDLDVDPSAIDAQLAADPVLAPLVAARPGLRSPGAVDGFEMAIRAVVGQQISVSGARTLLGRIAAEHGSQAFDGQAAQLFPDPAELAVVDPASLPMPRSRAETVLAIADACASGGLDLDPDADRHRQHAALLALPGIGPWTAAYIRMRAMGDRDVLLTTDLGVRRAADRLGVDLADGRPNWAPWRSYATHHLWAAGR
jgi:AraC family transcriptional regulator of adaptative response / DNA-3-methyladenine glycosylase II